MASKLLDPEAMAAGSQSQKRINAIKRDRPRYSHPVTAAQLNDKHGRASMRRMETQFSKTAKSMIPAENAKDADKWATSDLLIIHQHNTDTPERQAGPRKDRNIVSEEAAESKVMKIKCCVTQGGKEKLRNMMDTMLDSGEYDDMMREKLRKIDNGEKRMKTKLQVMDAADIKAHHAKEKDVRSIAEKKKTTNDIAADPKIGAPKKKTTWGALKARAQQYDC